MTTGLPILSANLVWIVLAVMSVLPPGGKGTTKVRGLSLWARARPDRENAANDSNRYLENKLRVIFIVKP
jgi:hypothetical protein